MNANDNKTKATSQNIQYIAIADMEPESGYQRATNPAQVSSIASKFNETRLGTLTVSARGGRYHVVDGAHRAKALRILGYTHAPCVVLTGLTFEQEADYFRRQSEDRRLIKPMEFFKAGLASGDERCHSINQIIKSNGFRVGSGKRDFFRISAVKALLTIADEYGEGTLNATLGLIARAWSTYRKASQSETLLGVAEFLSRYATINFAELMGKRFPAVFRDYAKTARTRASAGSKAAREKFCSAIVYHYNRSSATRGGMLMRREGQA